MSDPHQDQSTVPGSSAAVSASTAAEDARLLERAVYEVKKVVVGQDRLIEMIMVGLLSRGHILLEGVPGVAKTLTVETFATVVGGSFHRLQFTPDLVPADIVGTRIYRQGREEFEVELGPILANFVLADEINRAPAKVQSAAGGHCRGPRLDRRTDVPHAAAVPGHGHPEHHRERRGVRAAGSPA